MNIDSGKSSTRVGFVTVNGSTGTNSLAAAASRYWPDHATRQIQLITSAELDRGVRPDPGQDAIVDLGRLRPASANLAQAMACGVIVVSLGTSIGDMVTLLSRLAFLRSVARIELVLVGEGPYPVEELRRMTEVESIHVVPLVQIVGQYDEVVVRDRRKNWSKAVRRMTAHLVAATTETAGLDAVLRDPGVAGRRRHLLPVGGARSRFGDRHEG